MNRSTLFVCDGYARTCAAIQPQIRAVVEAEFSERLAAASLWGRFWLRRAIEREVRQRVRQSAPPEALY